MKDFVTTEEREQDFAVLTQRLLAVDKRYDAIQAEFYEKAMEYGYSASSEDLLVGLNVMWGNALQILIGIIEQTKYEIARQTIVRGADRENNGF